MRVALAICDSVPDWEVDDLPLHDALRSHGVELSMPAWEDATVDWSHFDGCLVRLTWNYMDRRAAFLRWADHVESVSRLFNSAEVVRWNTCKSYMRDLADEGVFTPETIFIEPGRVPDVRQLLGPKSWAKAILKPMVGASARETLAFATDSPGLADAQAHLERLIPSEGMLLQPFLESVETEGEISIMFVHGVATHAVQRVAAAGDYRMRKDFGSTDELVELSPKELELACSIREVAERRMRCADPFLYARVDFLRDADGELLLNELELVEPSMFFRHSPSAAQALADALLERLARR